MHLGPFAQEFRPDIKNLNKKKSTSRKKKKKKGKKERKKERKKVFMTFGQ